MQNTINHAGYITIRRQIENDKGNHLSGTKTDSIRYAYDFNCGDLVIHEDIKRYS